MAAVYTIIRLALVAWLLRVVWEMARLMVNEFR
jgi:hypothetical protein